MSEGAESENTEPLECKRCLQQHTIEFGYEPSQHGFCWPCCDEIVAKLYELADDKAFARFLADRAFEHFKAAVEAKQQLSESFEPRLIMEWFLKRGTARRE
jgi:hypothetical protein